jgi:hypothetical protein
MLINGKEQLIESFTALSEAINGQDIFPSESKRNIENNLVSLVSYNEKKLRDDICGLQLTTDGWVLVPYNAIAQYVGEWEEKNSTIPNTAQGISKWLSDSMNDYALITQDKKKRAIDTTSLIRSPRFDLALVKYLNNEEAKANHFLVGDINQWAEIDLVGIHKKKRYVEAGMVYSTNCQAYLDAHVTNDNILTDIVGEDERGALITPEGKLVGFATGSVVDDEEKDGWAIGVKHSNIKAFIDYAVQSVFAKYVGNWTNVIARDDLV